MKTKALKILFVSSECAPYAKVGGLGDVTAALPKILRRMGHDVRVVIPLYNFIDRAKYGIHPDGACRVPMGNNEFNGIGVHTASLDGGVPVWFVEHDRFYARAGIYDEPRGEYPDNAYRFALLSKAAAQICKDKHFVPDIMHAHDWPTGLVPLFLKTWDRVDSPLSNTASVLTIHNIAYQGVYPGNVFSYIGVGREHFTPDRLEDRGRVNLLKAGIWYADAITTVSPTHAKEILTPAGGCGLSHRLNARRDDLFGILNGVDYEHWNPETDPMIPARFSAGRLDGKMVCKSALQKLFQLQIRADLPLFGLVSRFAPQKGFNLLMDVLPRAMRSMAFQLVVLGTGDGKTENFFRWLENTFPGRARCHIGFSTEVSHLIEAGSDFFLMPSIYEPCGLNQIYSLKYGTLPLVRATGGLEDTVENYDPNTGNGTGFKFNDANPNALYNTLGWVVGTWYDRPAHITRLRLQAMAREFSWDDSARKYIDVYHHALRKKRGG